MNQPSLDKILKAEVFIHSDNQLRVAHLILRYTLISKSYLVSKCVINAKDLRLHQINVVASGFLTTGPNPEGTLTTNPIPEGIPKVALPFERVSEKEATPSQPTIKEGEEVIEVSDSENDFKVFN